MVVRDSPEDDRFKNNPFVTGPLKIRFYAGAPLVTPQGHAIATLCILDSSPQDLTEEQGRVLELHAKKVMAKLEQRKMFNGAQKVIESEGRELKALTKRLLEAQETSDIGSRE